MTIRWVTPAHTQYYLPSRMARDLCSGAALMSQSSLDEANSASFNR